MKTERRSKGIAILNDAAVKRRALLRGSWAVITRHGEKRHLWDGGESGRARTICGLEYIDTAHNADPDDANCSRCLKLK